MTRAAELPLLGATLLLASCGGGGSAAPPRPPAATADTRAQAADPCTSTPTAGNHHRVLIPGTPPAIFHIPKALKARRRVPLVLGVHGAGQDGRGFEGQSALSELADDRGFVVAYPQSWRDRGFWRYPEPDHPRAGIRLLRATIATAKEMACIDERRVLVTGISSGGRMTYSAGCQMADELLAIAPVSAGTRRLPRCRPSRPISIIDIHGTSDPIVGYRGHGRRRDGSVMKVMAGWALRNGCEPQPRRHRASEHVVRLHWRGCDDGVRVAHLRVEGGGHAWPPLGGPPGVDLYGEEAIWEFFSRLRPRSPQ